METRIVAQVSIDASKADTFNYLKNLKYHFLWNPHLQSIDPITVLKKGLEYQSVNLLLGVNVTFKNKVTKYKNNEEIEITNDTGPLVYKVNYRLSNSDGKTTLACSIVVASQTEAFAFTKPVLKLLARREIQADLKSLKSAVECNLSA